ncbi:sensor histidine kinase [Cohnella soli]|uniref:Sensor histidine kinase n=1 Tax=Cohnella soli TaxID=425005 RepID=A0ABW0I3B6_9BACL
MKLGYRLRNSSIFNKIMAVFVIALVPIYLINWRMSEKGAESIRTETSQSVANTTRFYLSSLDKEASRISDFLPKFAMDQSLMELGVSGNDLTAYERVEKVVAVQKQLDLMRYSSPYILEARAYVPQINRTLLSQKFETLIDKDEYSAMLQSGKLYEEPIIHWQDRLFITLQYPSNAWKNPLWVIGVELSKTQIANTLAQISQSLGGRSMLVNLDRHWQVAGSLDDKLVATLSQFVQEKQLDGVREGFDTIRYAGVRYLTVFAYSDVWHSYSVTIIPEKKIMAPLQKYRLWFWWAICIGLLVAFFFSISLFKLIHQPLKVLVQSFRQMRNNKLLPITVQRGEDEFAYLYHAFNETVQSLNTLIRENYEQKIRNQRSELKRLQSQINPHFLYNCFFVLYRLIKSDNKEKANRFCMHIGQYFEFITKNSADEIPLEEELRHSRTYVDMQSICYGERVFVRFEAETHPKALVPRLVIQPIIENAYKHAFGNMRERGELWVHSELTDDGWCCYVEDNGNRLEDETLVRLNEQFGRTPDIMEETTGILNVHRRIQLRYGDEYGLSVTRSPLGGMRVRLKLDIGEEEQP